ncbi:Chromo domain containing protein [Pyrenophora tritici-repentis]|nr:Chromo domain containing protein [Pyrenophora tritici-repentis]
MSFNSFPTQNFQFVNHSGPQKPKLTWRREHRRTMPSEEHDYLELNESPITRPALTSCRANDFNLASASENTFDLEIFGRKGDVSCLGVSYLQDKEGMEVEHFVSGGISEKALSGKSTGQPTLFEGDSPECAIVIADNHSKSDANKDDEGYPHDPSLSTQVHDDFGVKDHYETEDIEDALNSELINRPESQDSGLRHRELSSAPSTPSTGSSIVPTEQQANGNTLSENHVTMHEPQGPLNRGAEEHSKLAHLENTSRHSSDGSNGGTDDNTGNHRTLLTRKRQRSLPSKRRALDTQNCGTDPKICYSDDSSDSSSETSDRGRRLESNKRRKSTSWPHRSRSRGGADDDEYEVEQILAARVYRRKLQYRVKWLGYEDDPAWYDTSNFKNSPRKLREFHTANPSRPGPPARLNVWLQCWEEDRDTDDHSDDNKPQRSYAGRGTLRMPEPCGYSLRR